MSRRETPKLGTHFSTRIIMDKLKPGELTKSVESQLGSVSEYSSGHMQIASDFEWALTNSNVAILGHPCYGSKDVLGMS